MLHEPIIYIVLSQIYYINIDPIIVITVCFIMSIVGSLIIGNIYKHMKDIKLIKK